MNLLSLIVLFSSTFLADPVPISYKTISITNENFLVADDWPNVPVNTETGEDLNSKQFGGVYYPPYAKGSELVENRPTLAKGFMEVEIDFINQSEDTWILKALEMVITGEYSYSNIKVENGRWDLGDNRLNDYNPRFEIRRKLTADPEGFALFPQEYLEDSRIIFEASCESAEDEDTIFQFQVKCTFFNADDEDQVIEVLSDRDYLIATD